MMARPDIEAIAERADKATEGPWTSSIHVIHEDVREERVTGIGQTTEYEPDASAPQNSIIHLYSWWRKEPGQAWRNAEFIAHAREDVPALLAYIATLEAAFLASLTETLSQNSPTVIHEDIMDVLDELHALGVAGMDGEGTRRALMEGMQ